jgi:hypothetical protein
MHFVLIYLPIIVPRTCPLPDLIQTTIHRGNVVIARHVRKIRNEYCRLGFFQNHCSVAFFERCPMALEILFRNRRNSERSPMADRGDGSDRSQESLEKPEGTIDQGTVNQDTANPARPINDNGQAWPLIPFPAGWYCC